MIGAAVAVGAGFVLLVVASDRMVEGAAGLSLRLQVPAVVIGAVVVGFGTSAPELLASSFAAAGGSRDIAVGNIVGSNVANLTLVLGLVALVSAPTITSRVLRRESPLTVAGMLVLALVLLRLNRWTAAALLVAFAAAMFLLLRASRGTGDPLGAEVEIDLEEVAQRSTRALSLLTVVGLAGTVLGAHLLVVGARSIADRLELAEGLVGFTLVALGTSLPEVVTALQAARRGEPDLAVGNVLGSNLFNSLAIGGVAGLISPGTIAGGLAVTAWVSVGIGIAVWVFMGTSRRMERWEGTVLLAVYAGSVPLVA